MDREKPISGGKRKGGWACVVAAIVGVLLMASSVLYMYLSFYRGIRTYPGVCEVQSVGGTVVWVQGIILASLVFIGGLVLLVLAIMAPLSSKRHMRELMLEERRLEMRGDIPKRVAQLEADVTALEKQSTARHSVRKHIRIGGKRDSSG